MVTMDLDLCMEEAIRSGDHVTLERLLRTSSPSPKIVQYAKDRLEKKPQSKKRKEAINLLLEHGWDVNNKLGINDEPMLR